MKNQSTIKGDILPISINSINDHLKEQHDGLMKTHKDNQKRIEREKQIKAADYRV